MRRVFDCAESTVNWRRWLAVMLPSASHNCVGTPEVVCFRSSMAGLRVPLSTLRLRPYERLRMTRGRGGSLSLPRVTLTFTTPCRSPGALCAHTHVQFV